MQLRVSETMSAFLEDGDEEAVRMVLREELAFRRAGCEPLLRSWSSSDLPAGRESGATMLVAFGGLQQRVGGGLGAGVPPHEFVTSCRRAGAKYVLFVRDAARAWYCRGLSTGAPGFAGVVAAVRAEVAVVKPARLVTIGSSMGGYAAVRAGIDLGAEIAIGFSPQVLRRLRGGRGAVTWRRRGGPWAEVTAVLPRLAGAPGPRGKSRRRPASHAV